MDCFDLELFCMHNTLGCMVGVILEVLLIV